MLVLLGLVACTMRGQPEPGASGAEIFAVSGCIACHGEDRSGTGSGPNLQKLSEHWQSPLLASYLANPKDWIAKDQRLQELDNQFSSSMPSFDNLNLQERERLAHWLLTSN